MARPVRSRRTMVRAKPAGPMFFCAPAKMTPNLLTSYGSESMFEDMSATSGTFPVSGMEVNLVP